MSIAESLNVLKQELLEMFVPQPLERLQPCARANPCMRSSNRSGISPCNWVTAPSPPSSPTTAPAATRTGPLDLRTQAEGPSALRPDTPRVNLASKRFLRGLLDLRAQADFASVF